MVRVVTHIVNTVTINLVNQPAKYQTLPVEWVRMLDICFEHLTLTGLGRVTFSYQTHLGSMAGGRGGGVVLGLCYPRDPITKQITIGLATKRVSVASVAYNLAHELGHAQDYALGTANARTWIERETYADQIADQMVAIYAERYGDLGVCSWKRSK
jgi:hypothetical protein